MLSRVLRTCAFALCLLAAAYPLRALTVPQPTFPELVSKAETIARVKVLSQTAQWDTTPTGQRVIHTYVTAKILKTFKGTASDTVTLRFLGGVVGNTHFDIPDMPTFENGKRYIVFIAGNGRDFCPLVGVMHGRFTLQGASDADTTEAINENGLTRRDFEKRITQQLSSSAAP